jgi:NADPH:quinone reductase-like Zn-dependent oxidoreductase
MPQPADMEEHVSAPEELLALKLANLSSQQAATVLLAALTALQGLRNVERSGQGRRS